MRSSIATVCLAGTLEEKIEACAHAGFDGIEIMDMDVISSRLSPRAIGELVRSFGLTVELFQPIRDVEGVQPSAFAANARRFARKVDLAAELGAPGVLLCSNVGTATEQDDALIADQLHQLGGIAAASGLWVAYEALAWGKYVATYDHAWRLAAAADHSAVGTCLDSFHILSIGDDLSEIDTLPADRLFFCQIADARGLSLDPLTRSRHHRLFPGQGVFDLAGFVRAVQTVGYSGPLSLEVFNDVFRQSDTRTTAVDGLRSLRYLERLTSSTQHQATAAKSVDAVSLTSAHPAMVESLLALTGFTRSALSHEHESVWLQADAQVVVTEASADRELPMVGGMALRVPDVAAAIASAEDQLGPTRTDGPVTEVIAPDRTRIRFVSSSTAGGQPKTPGTLAPIGVVAIDHISLAQPWDRFDEGVLFYRAVAGLRPLVPVDIADPRGLILSQALENDDGSVRLVLTVDPSGLRPENNHVPPTHLGLRVTDIFHAAEAMAERGVGMLRIPDNYYDDLAARFELTDVELERLRRSNVLYDEDSSGGRYWQLYTRAYGDLFLELLQRDGGYSGYGASNAPVRRAAQQSTWTSADTRRR
ncbi:hypothetical protein BOH66_06230 [Microbacterium aurum]|uniref:VOC domain-containing protein n=1 Tax=Microbacterium aurum TaxID=36805 RepID=A0A1P8U707_9MICO|nr:sugar phosphate isomerase/epimerase and 4-hydroxyphenylpyruvate domain-containing protein [Microbacterium aurum]APZ33896.1 hypothetical protein BOH66_06230 [Microbacterium aurum]MBM7827657.1 4-hydroxyphenylpyruvate dioxygenase [Microbacterium aurum]